jgi:lipoprotein-anchoring transpeptidase ErfK/SrfK
VTVHPTPRRGPRRHRSHRSFAACLVVLVASVTGCGELAPAREPLPAGTAPVQLEETAPQPAPEAGGGETTVPAAPGAIIAMARVPTVEVYDEPGGGRPTHTLHHPREVGAPLTFLVDGERGDWLEVLLPVRPNGSNGWIRRADVELASTDYRVEVHLSDHRLLVLDREEVVIETPIGVGGDGTPTPPGRYYLTELLQPPDPEGPYGPYAFGLSGFSEVHLDFAGGEGVIGIHGTNDPSSIGRDSSNGCIRVDNDIITELASFLPLGTPVEIHA